MAAQRQGGGRGHRADAPDEHQRDEHVVCGRREGRRDARRKADGPKGGNGLEQNHVQIRPLSIDEARLLLKAAKRDRLYALYAVALSLGLRRGEALGLRWVDVELTTGVLHVRQTVQRHGGQLHYAPPKTPRSRRTIPLPPSCVKILERHRERQAEERITAGDSWQESDLVFTTPRGAPVEPNDFSKAFRRLCLAAGIRPVRLHDLRHTCASLLLAQGVPPRVVMEVLGHSSLDVTMNIYGHVMLDAQREALSRMEGLFQ
jgi:integrase